jgi:hypothetical protein
VISGSQIQEREEEEGKCLTEEMLREQAFEGGINTCKMGMDLKF